MVAAQCSEAARPDDPEPERGRGHEDVEVREALKIHETEAQDRGVIDAKGQEQPAGSAGAFLLKSAMQFIIYILMFGVLVYVFQTPITNMTGINPVAATLEFLGDMGLPVKTATDKLVTGSN